MEQDPSQLKEMQLRAEVMQLRRTNNNLDKRVGQMQGLLGELTPLWLEAPPEVQEQAQRALSLHTPRPGVVRQALATTEEEPEPPELEPAAQEPAWQQDVRQKPAREQSLPKVAPASTTAAKVPSLQLGAAKQQGRLSTGTQSSAPNTHRMDEDDDDMEQMEVVGGYSAGPIGEITASPEHYRAMLGSLKSEMATRQELESQLKTLRETGAATAAGPRPEAILKLDRALAVEEAARASVVNAAKALDQEWRWHGMPYGKAGARWGTLGPPVIS